MSLFIYVQKLTMINFNHKFQFFRRSVSRIVSIVFLVTTISPTQTIAQSIFNLPPVETAITLSPSFAPALIKGLTLDPHNPLKFNFIVSVGDDHLQGDAFQRESMKLVKYFLVALTLPENDMWVNLSPYEKDRIVPEHLGQTGMGRDLLLQDYMLKQLTASLMNPEEKLGAKFWDHVYQETKERFGTTDILMDTFNKIWIVPDKAQVYVKNQSVFVVESHLKVMLEEDYFVVREAPFVSRKEKALHASRDMGDLIREIILPAIEKEVNEGKNFASLRQIQNSAILAAWYKKNLKQTFLGQVYVNQKKTDGIHSDDKEAAQKVYNQYLQAFKKGVYTNVKEDYNSETQEIVSRKYFSGGFKETAEGIIDEASLPIAEERLMADSEPVRGVEVRLESFDAVSQSNPTDEAMIVENIPQNISQHFESQVRITRELFRRRMRRNEDRFFKGVRAIQSRQSSEIATLSVTAEESRRKHIAATLDERIRSHHDRRQKAIRTLYQRTMRRLQYRYLLRSLGQQAREALIKQRVDLDLIDSNEEKVALLRNLNKWFDHGHRTAARAYAQQILHYEESYYGEPSDSNSLVVFDHFVDHEGMIYRRTLSRLIARYIEQRDRINFLFPNGTQETVAAMFAAKLPQLRDMLADENYLIQRRARNVLVSLGVEHLPQTQPLAKEFIGPDRQSHGRTRSKKFREWIRERRNTSEIVSLTNAELARRFGLDVRTFVNILKEKDARKVLRDYWKERVDHLKDSWTDVPSWWEELSPKIKLALDKAYEDGIELWKISMKASQNGGKYVVELSYRSFSRVAASDGWLKEIALAVPLLQGQGDVNVSGKEISLNIQFDVASSHETQGGDGALLANPPQNGGIDLNANEKTLEERGDKIKLPILTNSTQWQNFQTNHFTPTIIHITPPTTLPLLLRAATPDASPKSMHVSSLN